MFSVGAQLQRHRGVGPGFDAARLALAVAILCWHSVLTSYGHDAEDAVWASPFSAPLVALMPMFFALSGFLVMGSFDRTRNLGTFMGLRALRILPALATEILISAFILGTMLTTRPLAAYFGDPAFLKYFGSLIGKVSLALPGVFETNPDPGRVNVSLWTIAPELSCYVYLGLQIALRLRRTGVTVAAAVLLLANIAADFGGASTVSDGVVLARYLVVSFAFGNLLYVWRDRIPFRPGLALVSLGLGLALIKVPALIYVALGALAYVVVVVGCCPIPTPYPFSTGDYSYGIYLYAFPVQQVFAQFFPHARTFYWNILFCLPVVCLIAFASWWCVEKPALRGRKLLYRLNPAADAPSALRMSLAAMALAAYGVLLSISSGFFPAGDVYIALPAAVLAAAVVATLRVRYLTRRPHGVVGSGLSVEVS